MQSAFFFEILKEFWPYHRVIVVDIRSQIQRPSRSSLPVHERSSSDAIREVRIDLQQSLIESLAALFEA